jgi:hypothetical protein
VDPALLSEWPIWLVISRQMATLEELETTWTLDDLIRAVDFIMIQCDIDKAAMKV